MKRPGLARNIFLALVLGSCFGLFFPGLAPYVSWMGLAFKLSLSMVVMPIIFCSILGAMGAIKDIKKLGQLGRNTLVFFLLSTLVSVTIGISLVTAIRPGILPAPREVEAKLSQLRTDNLQEAPALFAEEIASVLGPDLSKDEKADLLETLVLEAKTGQSIDALRDEALRLVGSLEVRRQLNASEKKSLQALSPHGFFEAQIQKIFVNPFEALAKKDVLAVIFFALLLGTALHRVGPQGVRIFELNEVLSQALTQIMHMIMRFAPFGVFGLLVDVVATTGISVFRTLGMYVMTVILGLGIMILVVYPLMLWIFARRSPKAFYIAMRQALVVAFSTSSSNATLKVTLQCLEEGLQIKPHVARFVVPLGATMNLNGTAVYEAVAAVFIAQLYGLSLDFSGQVMIALTAAVAATGAAGIPAAGTVTLALVLQAAGLPLEGIGLLLAVDRPLDMCRTVVNVAGDAAGAVVLQRYDVSASLDDASVPSGNAVA
jgi:Na+/H+-dicarboxylate symporter